MTTSSIIQKNLAKVLFVSFGALASNVATANSEEQKTALKTPAEKQPSDGSANSLLPKSTSDVHDLKFREFFRMPIGPRGLEASPKLISLADKRVHLIGYMVRQETPTNGFFILSPLPVALGDEDESLSDDLPASTVFVHIDPPTQIIPFHAGLVSLTGTLKLGPYDESDGHVSTIRLQLDPEQAKAMITAHIEK